MMRLPIKTFVESLKLPFLEPDMIDNWISWIGSRFDGVFHEEVFLHECGHFAVVPDWYYYDTRHTHYGNWKRWYDPTFNPVYKGQTPPVPTILIKGQTFLDEYAVRAWEILAAPQLGIENPGNYMVVFPEQGKLNDGFEQLKQFGMVDGIFRPCNHCKVL